jgi:hypothetical protein
MCFEHIKPLYYMMNTYKYTSPRFIHIETKTRSCHYKNCNEKGVKNFNKKTYCVEHYFDMLETEDKRVINFLNDEPELLMFIQELPGESLGMVYTYLFDKNKFPMTHTEIKDALKSVPVELRDTYDNGEHKKEVKKHPGFYKLLKIMQNNEHEALVQFWSTQDEDDECRFGEREIPGVITKIYHL